MRKVTRWSGHIWNRVQKREPVSGWVIPVPDLPPRLIERLRAIAAKKEARHGKETARRDLLRALARMENIDHRRELYGRVWPDRADTWGFRIRQFNVARTFPGTELALKASHDWTARRTILIVNKRVRTHNFFHPRAPYILLKPKAHEITDDIIAMPKINAPSILEILGNQDNEGFSPRGKAFFKKLKESFGVNEEKLEREADVIEQRTGFEWRNLLLLGVSNGKFVFMPLVDVE